MDPDLDPWSQSRGCVAMYLTPLIRGDWGGGGGWTCSVVLRRLLFVFVFFFYCFVCCPFETGFPVVLDDNLLCILECH